ncbi:VC0807 family protein [Fodinicola acaciae]|uniref:VC0807 family protein n=1 Tax=Fodinicola acaciae TaxID=2681555 RepID=UPI0013D25BEE|nr:VC0807 family protein [Fodinicola acaciae]
MRQHVIHLPSPRAMMHHAVPHLLESTLIPLGLFYVVLTTIGLDSAMWAALGWAGAAIGVRAIRRRPVPAVLVLTTTLLLARTVLGLMTDSAFLYFLQPTLQNFLLALAFAATAVLGRPLLAKLADDFCAFPGALTSRPGVQRFFRQVSMLWALVFVANGLGTLWILAKETVGDYLMVSTAGSYALIGLAAVLSLGWFRRSLRGEGIVLRLGSAG